MSQGAIEPTTAQKTDEYGNPIDEINEQDPDMEAKFSEINNSRTTTVPTTVTEAAAEWIGGEDYNSGYDDGSQWDGGYDDGSGYDNGYTDNGYGGYDGSQW